ncbi:hypothetical protein [Microcystis flos-aquae]|nr:hypothetical protein [Microcystis flos-aquae]
MSKFKLFDDIQLTEDIPLTDGGIAPIGTVGARNVESRNKTLHLRT